MIGSYIALVLLEPPTGAGVESHDDQYDDAESEVDKVKHDWLRLRKLWE
jgi:hypothetical protein